MTLLDFRHCNCDAADEEKRSDAGIFDNKDDLPVTYVNFNLGETGKVVIGDLYCADKEISKFAL